MSASIILLGGGEHARVVAEVLELTKSCTFIGFVDKNPENKKLSGFNIRYLGSDDSIFSHKPTDIRLANGIGSVRDTGNRRKIFEIFREKGYVFTSLTHPSAVVSPRTTIEEGAQIMAGAVVQIGAKIGRNAIINTCAAVDHDCEIGAHAHISPGVVLSGRVRVGEGTHIGTGAKVIQGIEIGSNCLIAAGAVVVENIPDHSFAAGVPAKIRSLAKD